MSYHLPSQRDYETAEWERAHVQNQLDARDNPYALEVDPDLCCPPPPLVEGQVLTLDRLTHKHGRILKRHVLVAIRYRGELQWCEL